MSFEVANGIIGDEKIFIIAEIGQNHQGDIELAKRMIASAKQNGADCVKFQKSNLREKFTTSALVRPYNSPHSWGRTYGEHKQYLEFTIEQYKVLQAYANEVDILFTASAMDIISLRQLNDLNVPFIKIGSGDANNIPLIVEAAQMAVPLMISTGMQSEEVISKIVKIMRENGKRNFCLMHCVSSYPTQPEDACLRLLELYCEWFPDVCVGYSGHEQGLVITAGAVLLGAKVIERHFTLDRNQKGSDHKVSLEPDQLKQLTEMVRNLEKCLKTSEFTSKGDDSIIKIIQELNPSIDENVEKLKLALTPISTRYIFDCEYDCFNKLGKSLVYRRSLREGSVLTAEDICAKVSEPSGIPADRYFHFVGLTLQEDVFVDDNVIHTHFLKKMCSAPRESITGFF